MSTLPWRRWFYAIEIFSFHNFLLDFSHTLFSQPLMIFRAPTPRLIDASLEYSIDHVLSTQHVPGITPNTHAFNPSPNTSGRVQASFPSAFGEWLTIMCGKSNKNGEESFSSLFKKRMFVWGKYMWRWRRESSGSCERRETWWNRFQQFEELLCVQNSK